jgi:DnaJ family protein B protein 12
VCEVVSKAFQVLSDADKKQKYDKFGGDPESRHQAAGASPFSNFARSSRAGPSMYEDGPEISPEELFRQFFGGGMGGGFPGFGKYTSLYQKRMLTVITAFDTGPQFVFNMGGPGIRVTQFGGGQPRRRPRPGEPEPQQTVGGTITSLLPLILLFLIPILSSLFSGSGSAGPSFTFDKSTQHTKSVKTSNLKIPYWVIPSEFTDLTRNQRSQLDHKVEVELVSDLKHKCQQEKTVQENLMMDAQGWFSTDEQLMEKARNMKLKACERLGELKNRV